MPELVEVEFARYQLERVCVGRKIASLTSVCDTDTNVFCDSTRGTDGLKTVVGKKVVRTGRKGKQLWIELSSPPHLVMHFGMTGGISVEGDPENRQYMGRKAKDNETSPWPPRFTKMEWTLSDGGKVAYTDQRRFGKIDMCATKPQEHPAVKKLGFDCLYEIPTEENFLTLIAENQNVPTVKGLLLDQSFSAGVGNWIADEVLFEARLHPRRPVRSLASSEIIRLRSSLENIVRTAVGAKSDPLKYPPHWLFHIRWKSRGRAKNGQTADGVRVKVEKIAGRSTVLAPSLQPFRSTRPEECDSSGVHSGKAEGSPDGGAVPSSGEGQSLNASKLDVSVPEISSRRNRARKRARKATEPVTDTVGESNRRKLRRSPRMRRSAPLA